MSGHFHLESGYNRACGLKENRLSSSCGVHLSSRSKPTSQLAKSRPTRPKTKYKREEFGMLCILIREKITTVFLRRVGGGHNLI